MDKILNYIGGELIEPTSGNYLDNIEPANILIAAIIPSLQAARRNPAETLQVNQL